MEKRKYFIPVAIRHYHHPINQSHQEKLTNVPTQAPGFYAKYEYVNNNRNETLLLNVLTDARCMRRVDSLGNEGCLLRFKAYLMFVCCEWDDAC